ncbi:MAG: adenosine kinase [Chlamydiia bacterium]|nr:adenosine kinase [Chlamydiia bacterium]
MTLLGKIILITSLLIKGFATESCQGKEYDVIALGAAIVDHFFFITKEEQKSIRGEKGEWAPIDFQTLSSILEKNQGVAKTISGGSGANVLKGLAQLGKKCAIIGKVGSDEKGEYYVKKMEELGIVSFLQKGSLPTGQTVCLITPDGERTFRSYLGASHSLSDLNINEGIFNKTRLFHIEGYQLIDPDLVTRTLKGAKESGALISLDLANAGIIRQNKEFVHSVIENYVDIVFCSEIEAGELTGLSASSACDKLSAFCKIAVVTMGEKGSWACSGNQKVFMEAFPVKTVDTTGAGDLYAAGFLYGYLNGEPLRRCAWIGSFVASHVVKMVGAEIPPAIWEEIRKGMQEETIKKATPGVAVGPALQTSRAL